MDVRKFRGAGVLMLCLLLTAAGVWNFQSGSLPVAGRRGDEGVPVMEGRVTEPEIGLLFQVTGSRENVEEIQRILRERGKQATFFVTEAWAEKWPETVTTLAKEGHEVGLLSPEGKRWDQLSQKEASLMLREATEKLKGLTGEKTALFQEPGNRYGAGLLKALQAADLRAVGWSLDSGDWKDYSSEVICQEVMESEELRPGALVLFHTGAENMAPALEQLLPKLGAMGYGIVPAGQLF